MNTFVVVTLPFKNLVTVLSVVAFILKSGALTAVSLSVGNSGVLFTVGMAMWAMRSFSSSMTSPVYVDLVWNRFKVVWPDAVSNFAQMIYLCTFWNRTIVNFVRVAMGKSASAVVVAHPISFGIDEPSPQPTRISFFNVVPENLFQVVLRALSTHNLDILSKFKLGENGK